MPLPGLGKRHFRLTYCRVALRLSRSHREPHVVYLLAGAEGSAIDGGGARSMTQN